MDITITQSANNDRLEVTGTAFGSVELKGIYVSKTVTFSSSSVRDQAENACSTSSMTASSSRQF